MIDYYDRDGNPVNFEQWSELMGDDNYKRIALGELRTDIDAIENLIGVGTTVSTVWLGISHTLLGDGPPQIFETMIFGGPYEREMMRYATMDEALDGHQRVMQDLADGRAPWWLTE